MGEYAKYQGTQIKMGTCEDMYYLRYEQRHLVERESGSVDPVADASALRFRFPFPDEDGVEPGSNTFHDKGFHRGLHIPGFTVPAGVDHSQVQFVAQAGYVVSLPCPESTAYTTTGVNEVTAMTLAALPSVRVHRNGFHGSVHLVAQRFIDGVGLVPILRCGGCGTMWREVEVERIEELAMCARAEGDRRAKDNTGDFWQTIADRLLLGITTEVSR